VDLVPVLIEKRLIQKLVDGIVGQYKQAGLSFLLDCEATELNFLARVASMATIPVLHGLISQGIVKVLRLAFLSANSYARSKIIPSMLSAIENLFILSITDCALQMQIVVDLKEDSVILKLSLVEVHYVLIKYARQIFPLLFCVCRMRTVCKPPIWSEC
jgi:hypothetical protein